MSNQDVLLRKGKWTPEEESYANLIISLFNQGRLSLVAGTTLRSYLSEKLRCDPMRITKKYAGTQSIGKQVYQPSEETLENPQLLKQSEAELHRLEQLFLKRINSRSWAEELSSPDADSARRTHSTRSLRARDKSVDFTDYFTGDLEDMVKQAEQEDLNTNNSSQSSRRRGLRSNIAELESAVSPAVRVSTGRSQLRRVDDDSAPTISARQTSFTSSRRVYSAPNLSALAEPYPTPSLDSPGKGIFSSSFYNRNSHLVDDTKNDSAVEAVVHSSSFLPSSNTSNESSNSGNRGMRKRSNSVMALMDFEKLVRDDRAADDLFLEFVTQVREKTDNNKRLKMEESMPSSSSHIANSDAYFLGKASDKLIAIDNSIVRQESNDEKVRINGTQQDQRGNADIVDTNDQDNFF